MNNALNNLNRALFGNKTEINTNNRQNEEREEGEIIDDSREEYFRDLEQQYMQQQQEIANNFQQEVQPNIHIQNENNHIADLEYDDTDYATGSRRNRSTSGHHPYRRVTRSRRNSDVEFNNNNYNLGRWNI